MPNHNMLNMSNRTPLLNIQKDRPGYLSTRKRHIATLRIANACLYILQCVLKTDIPLVNWRVHQRLSQLESQHRFIAHAHTRSATGTTVRRFLYQPSLNTEGINAICLKTIVEFMQ